MSRLIVGLSNLLTRARRTRVKPEELLMLFPRCLQNSDCPCNIVKDVANCKHDRKCKVGDLIDLAEKYGCRIVFATGGQLALREVKAESIRAVVAVACNKELRMGILAAFPKAVIGVPNTCPHGPCADTDVDLDKVEKAIQWFLRE